MAVDICSSAVMLLVHTGISVIGISINFLY